MNIKGNNLRGFDLKNPLAVDTERLRKYRLAVKHEKRLVGALSRGGRRN